MRQGCFWIFRPLEKQTREETQTFCQIFIWSGYEQFQTSRYVWNAYSKLIHYVNNTFHMWGANMRVACVKVNAYHVNTHV